MRSIALPAAEKDKFVELFYDEYVKLLLEAVVAAGDKPNDPKAPAANTGAHGGWLWRQGWARLGRLERHWVDCHPA